MDKKTLIACILSNTPVHLVGDPGGGKTAILSSIWKGIAKVYGYAKGNFVPKLLSQIDATDLGGFPREDGPVVRLKPLEWVQRLSDSPGMLFLDEYSLAPRSNMAAALTMIQDRLVGEIPLHPDTLIVLASNPARFTGVDLLPQAANRMLHVDMEDIVSIQEWASGLRSGFPVPDVQALPTDWTDLVAKSRAEFASYVEKMGSEAFKLPKDNDAALGAAWPSRRSWTNAMTVAGACQSQGLDDSAAIAASVGEGAALGYVSWRANQDLGDPMAALADPKGYVLPTRDDSLYILLTSAASIAIQKPAKIWEGCWTLLERACQNGRQDIACIAGRTLIEQYPKGATIPSSAKALIPMLTAARNSESGKGK